MAAQRDDATLASLLRRAQYGVRMSEWTQAVADGWDATVDRLLSPQPESETFQKAESALWQTALATANVTDLKAWWLYRMVHSANPLLEKLTLFWHNHFATSYAKVNSVPQMAVQNQLLRQYALGSFRDLLDGMARDPAMLVWLDGNANRKRHPNENFAREVMELFSLGIGNYTERDIQEAARAFSGWQLHDGAFWFNKSQHDHREKTIFGKTGRYQGNDVIDLCLDHPASYRYIAGKLLKTFVTPTPTDALIDRVAGDLKRHDWQMKPVMQSLLLSREIAAAENIGTLIKSPLDFVLGTLRPLANIVHWQPVRERLAELGQDVFEPPSVKGWDGGRLWLHAAAYIQRLNFLSETVADQRFAELDPTGLLADPDPLQTWPRLLIAGQLAPEIQSTLQQIWQTASGNTDSRRRTLLTAILTLPEYQLM